MRSKRYKKLPENTKELSAELIEKLIPELKKNCTTKFDESIDLSMQINNKQKKNEINLRTVVNLPSGSGKKIKVAVVCEDSKVQIAKDSGADIAGSDEFIENWGYGDTFSRDNVNLAGSEAAGINIVIDPVTGEESLVGPCMDVLESEYCECFEDGTSGCFCPPAGEECNGNSGIFPSFFLFLFEGYFERYSLLYGYPHYRYLRFVVVDFLFLKRFLQL